MQDHFAGERALALLSTGCPLWGIEPQLPEKRHPVPGQRRGTFGHFCLPSFSGIVVVLLRAVWR
jgi:hypothetical protein